MEIYSTANWFKYMLVVEVFCIIDEYFWTSNIKSNARFELRSCNLEYDIEEKLTGNQRSN